MTSKSFDYNNVTEWSIEQRCDDEEGRGYKLSRVLCDETSIPHFDLEMIVYSEDEHGVEKKTHYDLLSCIKESELKTIITLLDMVKQMLYVMPRYT